MSNIKEIKIAETLVFMRDVESISAQIKVSLLTQDELNRFESFKCQKRRATFVGVRSLIQHIWPGDQIIYNKIGAPTLLFHSSEFISISHSHYLCAIAKNSKNAIGLDIEFHSGQATRLRNRFVHEEEEQLITNALEDTLVWSAKEALYKIAGVKKLIFKEQLRLTSHDPSTNKMEAYVHFHDGIVKKYQIDYLIEGNLIITLAQPVP